MAENVFRVSGGVSREQRAAVTGQQGCVVWFTGLSGSGKTTVALAVEAELIRRKRAAYLLDGDNLRHGLCADLGFSCAERAENIRRIGNVAALFEDAGLVCLVSAISPDDAVRKAAAACCRNFLLVYVKASIEECERRDVKGLYAKARRGEITGFTGIDAPYEVPLSPDITADTEHGSVEQCAAQVLAAIDGILNK